MRKFNAIKGTEIPRKRVLGLQIQQQTIKREGRLYSGHCVKFKIPKSTTTSSPHHQ